MRRYAKSLILIAFLVTIALLILGTQKVKIGEFERGGDTLLGLDLGLELQGGSHLVYQASLKDVDTGDSILPTPDQMEGLRKIIERRVNATGLADPDIQLMGDDRLLLQLPGVSDPDRIRDLIGETARLDFRHRRIDVPRDLDEIDGDIVSVTVGRLTEDGMMSESHSEMSAEDDESKGESSEEGKEPSEDKVPAGDDEPKGESSEEGKEPSGDKVPAGDDESKGESSKESQAGGVGEPTTEELGPPVLIVEFTEEGAGEFSEVVDRLHDSLLPFAVPGGDVSVPASRLDISVEGNELIRFQAVSLSILQIDDSNRFAFSLPLGDLNIEQENEEAIRSLLGDKPTIHFTEIQGGVDEDIGLTGEDLARAYPSQHRVSGEPIVNLEFKSTGARTFGELTGRIAGSGTDAIAIFLDDSELIAPVVETPITTGVAIIQGNFTLQRASDISLLLESGRLPVPIELIEERDVDAILGADSLAASLVAGLVGLALVLLFMVVYYRIPGIVASMALLMYTVFILAIFKMLPVTLNLSGVAAVILSIGMAVDANILIFERMKDELRAGRTLLSAINIGFNRAWPAIRDGNVSTLITCAILYWFSDQLGATIVQGFAATLAIGVVVSMFSAITVSKTLLRVLAATGLAKHLGMFVPSGGGELPQEG